MKYLFITLFFLTIAFADNDGCTDLRTGALPPSAGNDAVQLTLLNDWVLDDKALGLDVFEGPASFYILGADNMNDWIRAFDPATGAPTGTLNLDPANGSCFGVAWNNDYTNDTYYTDDWSNTNLFFTDNFGTTWTQTPNPAGNSARGMDFDGTDYWTTNGNGGGLWRFTPGGSQENISIPQITTLPSGITVFPYGSDIGVAVTAYSTLSIFFYDWDGSSLTFIGSAPCPATNVASSFGLAYADTNGNIFWSYKDNTGNYHLAEFSFTTSVLEQSSWGAIKSSF